MAQQQTVTTSTQKAKTGETTEPSISGDRQNVLESFGKTVSDVASNIMSTAQGLIDRVRKNDGVLISNQHVSTGPAVEQLKQDLDAISDVLKKAGVDIGDPKADVFSSLKKLQEKAMIGEDGQVYVKGKDGFYRVDKETGEISKEKYTGKHEGLHVDGVAGPRSYFVIDALLGRGKGGGMMEFESFKTVTGGIWDVSQVPENYKNLAGDGASVGTTINWGSQEKLEAEAKKYINENNPEFNVPAGCFRASWHVAGKILGVGIGGELDAGEVSADGNSSAVSSDPKERALRGKSLMTLGDIGLVVGDVVYVSAVPGSDPSSMNMANKPHWAVVSGLDDRGKPIFSDNWGTFNTEQFADAYGGRAIDEVFRNSKGRA